MSSLSPQAEPSRPAAPSPPPPSQSQQQGQQNVDLRHMTSNPTLLSPSSPKDPHHHGGRPGRRTSQHLRTSGGLGSPTSIPSSPTSIHSSSSAIFERDIEPLLPPSPPTVSSSHPASSSAHPGSSSSATSPTQRVLDPHRIPRARNTEHLDQSVPSVLDSAAAILTDNSPTAASPDSVSVVAPANTSAIFDQLLQRGGGGNSGFASPLSLRSRSPSPSIGKGATGVGQGRPESLLLLNIPPAGGSSTIVPMGRSTSTSSSTAPTNTTTTSAANATSQPTGAGSPLLPSPTSLTSPHAPSPPNSTSHPPSPSHGLSKRLSFMSYSDLLTSVPASTHTLSQLTTSASTSEPPPHIPGVSGLNLVNATASIASASTSAAGSLRNFSMSSAAAEGAPSLNAAVLENLNVHGSERGGLSHAGKRESIALLDNVGGEWERSGMGRGMEERLELDGDLGAGGTVRA